jgi:hypothetical protein
MYREIAQQKKEKAEREKVNGRGRRSMRPRRGTTRRSTPKQWPRPVARRKRAESGGSPKDDISPNAAYIVLTKWCCAMLNLFRDVRQKNEGNFVFSWDEEGTPGSIVLEVRLPKHMDSSLIDVDVHPTYVSVVVKGKVSDSDDAFMDYCID